MTFPNSTRVVSYGADIITVKFTTLGLQAKM